MNKLPDDWQTCEYGSHWHLLTKVMKAFSPRTVLETGSGLYSTNLLLTFAIDRLVSLENNPEWQTKPEDERHKLVKVAGPIANALPPLDDFDLVFVDDDPVEERAATISRVLAEAPGLVVIHDTEYDLFHNLIAGRSNYTDTERFPNTTVLHPRTSEDFRSWLATA